MPKVAAIIVVFYPDTEVFARFAMIRKEVDHLVVVDNGAPDETRALLDAWVRANNAALISNFTNLGLAAALNRGMCWAEELGCDWVVTFDQDSTPFPGMVAALLASVRSAPRPESVAAVGAHTFDEHTGRRDRWLRPAALGFRRPFCRDTDLTGITFVITSGCLTRLKAWRELGGFDEGLFIDYIDHDFCLKARRTGNEIMVSAAAKLAHNLGAKREVAVAGRKLRPTFHSSIRHYYMARNRILMWRRHAWANPHWWLFDACFGAMNMARVFVAEDERAKKFSAVMLGTWDGLCGRTGPCPEYRRHSLQT